MTVASSHRNAGVCSLGSVASINPASIGKGYPHEEIEYIDISSVGSGILGETTIYKIADAPSRARRLVAEGDTILSTVRPNRRSFLFIKNPPANLVVSTGFAVLRARDQIDPRFLYYRVTNYSFTDYLAANAKGAAYPAVDTDTIARARIRLPPLATQCKIAAVLSPYDDLIENNQRRIKILEEIAQALYGEWFVKFRFPGHKKVRIVDSPLGKIPEGWEVKPMAEMCEFISRGVTPRYQAGSGRYIINQRANRGSYLNLPDLKELRPNLKVPEEKLAHREDLLVNSLGEGTLGRAHYFNGPHKEWAVDQHMTICRSSVPGITLYLYMALASPEGQARIQAVKTGATNMTMLNISTLRKLEFAFPARELLQRYHDYTKPLMELKRRLEQKNKNLCQTRDHLLPKLISGELDVSDLDIDVGGGVV